MSKIAFLKKSKLKEKTGKTEGLTVFFLKGD